MSRKSFSVLMIVLLVFLLVACSDEGAEPGATLTEQRHEEVLSELVATNAKLDTVSEMIGTLALAIGEANDLVVVLPEEVAEEIVEEVVVADEPVELEDVRYIQFKIYDPIYVAKDKGFCEQRGVNVIFASDAIAGPNAIQAVAGGSAEVGVSSIAAIVNANAAGLPIQGVVDLQTTMGDQHLQRWFALKDSDIENAEDTVGSNYAVNVMRSSFHYTTLMMLDELGVDESDMNFILLSFGNQIPALIEGEVDVIGLMPPYQGYLENEFGDQVKEVWNDHELYGDKQFSLTFVNRVWAREKPEVARAFVDCYVDAINWIEDNQAAAAEIVSSYTEIPPEAISDYHYTENGMVVQEDVQFWLDYLLERGDIEADWLEVEDIATNKFNSVVVEND